MENRLRESIENHDIEDVISRQDSIVDVLQLRAEFHPHECAYTFLIDGENQTQQLSYRELEYRAKKIAAAINLSVEPGQRGVLLYPPGLDFVVTFFACLYAGVIAVPAYPPKNRRHLPRIQAIIKDCQASIILSTEQTQSAVLKVMPEQNTTWLLTDQIKDEGLTNRQVPLIDKNSLAFLQYTSGSTGNAKGVMVSHANLMANQQLIKQGFEHNRNTPVVGWLPMYHDMGLIGNVLQPLFIGAPVVLMSPMAFLEKPIRWLQAISSYQAHTSGGPNFAFDLCVEKITQEQKPELDLSSWKLAFNGSEPVRANTLQRFESAFAECGFSRETFYPCYGLAEATLLATGSNKSTPPTVKAFNKNSLKTHQVQSDSGLTEDNIRLVGCGMTGLEHGLKIVNPNDGTDCQADQVGEIWLTGASVAKGYWEKQELSKETFVDGHQQQTWLRTGDFGFVDNGELFVSGRLKDLIIVRGQNYYPQDIECAAESADEALNPHCSAAFSINKNNQEALVLLAELKRSCLRQTDYKTQFSAIRKRLVDECGTQADIIMLLKPGSILRTTSGKIQRSACRNAFENNVFKAVAIDQVEASNSQHKTDPVASEHHPKPTTEMTLLRKLLISVSESDAVSLLAQSLADKVASLSGLERSQIDLTSSALSLGIDSLKAVELKYYLDELLDIELPVVLFLENNAIEFCAEKAIKLAKESIEPVSVSEDLYNSNEMPLLLGQKALWTASRIEGHRAIYNMSVAIRIRSVISEQALNNALQILIKRHKQLQVSFRINQKTEPVQVLSTEKKPALQKIDCTNEQQRMQKINNKIRKLFDLEFGPLLWTALFSLTEEDHILVFCAHHSIVDFRSLSIMLDELKLIYSAQLSGQTANLKPASADYSDYVRWQRAYLDSAQAEQAWQYWQQQLSGELPKLELTNSRTRPSTPSYQGNTETLIIAPQTLQQLKQLAVDHDATLYMVLLALFKTLLYRYSGQQDLIVGSPTLGRPKQAFAKTVGYFVNPVALRSHPADDKTFNDYLAEVKQTVVCALEHQDYPFSELVRKLQPDRDVGLSPFYQVMFVLQGGHADAASLALSIPETSINWPSIKAETVAITESIAQFDITLMMAETEQGLAASFQYNTELFDKTTIVMLLGHFQCLLQGILADSNKHLSELPLLTEIENTQLLNWNKTAVKTSEAVCIHQLFEEQVNKTPQASAVVYREQNLSYGELNAKANQLAHQLRAHGVKPEARIAVCMHRSIELPIALLAVLKAGAVYVPVDPNTPQDRQAYLLQDADIDLILTHSDLAKTIVSENSTIICVDEHSVYQTNSIQNLQIQGHKDQAAYIIYTSGSTGKPKGVVVSHGNVVHSTSARFHYYQQPVGCYLLLSSFAFDSSVAGLFWTLSQGGCLCLPEDEQIKAPLSLGALIKQRQVTHLLALPPLYIALLEQIPAETLASLTTVIVAGEACSNKVVEQHFTQLPRTLLFNEYGPTEATVWSSVHAIEAAQTEATVSIGKPIANMRLYITDQSFQPVPVGVAGELTIGGAGITRGYLNQAGLTAEKFILDPFSTTGERLYKTGDLASYRADGSIEFLGRIDHQVKIRGYRIELGEIEVCLLNHPDVKQAIVIVREDQPGNKRLVAYIVTEQSNELETADLKNYLKQSIPDYMVPSAFVFLETLPLNANGKLDRKALPAPEYKSQEYSKYIEPKSKIECELVTIWSELLAIEKVGINDNFFELGGDSILSIQFVTQAQRAGLFFTPKQIFEHQTIKALAGVASHQQNMSVEQGLETGKVLLSPIQHWFFELNRFNPHHWNQVVVLSFERNIDRTLLKQALHLLLLHHDMLRVRFREESGEWLQHISHESDVEVEYENISGLSFQQQQECMSTAAMNRVNIKEGPVLRAILFDPGKEKGQKLLLSIHHLAVDAVSWRFILQDFQTLYQQLVQHEPTHLPLKTSSFKCWSQALVEFAHSPQLLKQADNWTALYNNKPKALPVDMPQGDNNEGLVETITVALSIAETQQLLHDVPPVYRTQINDILLTALAKTLGFWNACDSVLIDLESHGRHAFADNLDVSRTVGWFSNVYPVNLQLTADSGALMIKSVKEQLRLITDHGLSYSLLRYLSPDKKVQNCLKEQLQAQVLFNYLGRTDQNSASDSTDAFKVEYFAKSCAAESPRSYEIEVIASIQQGALVIAWNFSQQRYLTQTIDTLAQSFVAHLHALIEHCLLPGSGGISPSDFPLAELTQQNLDHIPVSHKDIEDIYPLTPLQQGMLFHSLSEHDSGLYVNQLKCRLQGNINSKVFEQAWQQTIANHTALHTGFFWKEVANPIQIVVKQFSFAIQYLDWRDIEPDEQAKQCQQYSENDRKSPIDLSNPPLMRITLIHLDDDQFYFVWTHHHIVLDGWSSSLLFAEVFNRYALLLKSNPTFLPSAPPFKNYLEWIGLQDKVVVEEYWKTRLQNFTVPTRLGIEKPKEEGLANTEYVELERTLSEEQSIHFKTFAKQHKVTLNTLLQSAWALVLSAYSNEQDVVFGVTVSGRSAEINAVDEIVGLFINTLPLRIQSSQNDRINDWLQQIQAQNLQMRQYEHTALADVQKWSDIASKQPLFDSIMVFENYPLDQAELEQVSSFVIQDITTIERTNYPLTIAIFPGSELTVKIIYDTQQFEEAHIKKLLNHFHQALNAITNEKNKRIHQVSLLNAQEHMQQLQGWNATQAYYPENCCIHTLFETQAAKTPDAIAAVFMRDSLSYAELNKQANQLAHYLILKGVRTETKVGICMERSLNIVIGIMAILKSGASYVPIDPAYPVERINFVLKDAEISVLLSQTDLIESLSVDKGIDVISVDKADSQYSRNDFFNPDTHVRSDNCAYIIYTSGSTGKPKGVVVNHYNLVNSVWARTQYYQESVSRYLLLSSFAFDSSVAGIFWTLIQGGCLCLIDENTSKDPWEIGKLIKQKQVTHLLGLPSLYNELLEHVSKQSLTSLNTVIVAGETCTKEVVVKHYQNVPDVKLYNEYGPTEGTVWSSVHAVSEDKQSNIVPIGCPISNMQMYILDRHLTPQPVGIAGELVIGGIGITRGYLNRPDLTAEKYIPDPFSSRHGNRLYRTGDLARYRSDGNIEFLGRIDHQVKIRGHRIELGEIESRLLEHPDIKEAIVLAQGELVKLAAYVVPEQKAELNFISIKKYLLQSLPHYMLPATFVVIEHMPLNANGKVNQQALPMAAEINHCTNRVIQLPTDPVGQDIARIWAEVLQIDEVGIDQDFFELGGHSLLAIQVISRIQQTFNIEMSVDTLFSKPTISKLSESIIQLQIEQQGDMDISELLDELELLSDEEVSNNLFE